VGRYSFTVRLFHSLHRAGVTGAQEKRMRTLTRKTPIHTGVLAMLVLVTLNVPGRAGELAGATLPDTLSAGDETLKLNGMGLRKKAMFKVYVGGLYLESPSKDAGTILATDQAKAIRMYFLRDLTKAQLVEAFQEGSRRTPRKRPDRRLCSTRCSRSSPT
jgi:hypothetical protein